jgi:hypothetical protein
MDDQITNANVTAAEQQSRAVQMERQPTMVARKISDSQALNFSHDYFLLERRRRRLADERKQLDAVYKKLKQEIAAEEKEILAEQERLGAGIFYGVIEDSLDFVPDAEKPHAKTSLNLVTPTK